MVYILNKIRNYIGSLAGVRGEKGGLHGGGTFARRQRLSCPLKCTEIVITQQQKGVFIGRFFVLRGLYNNKYKLTV